MGQSYKPPAREADDPASGVRASVPGEQMGRRRDLYEHGPGGDGGGAAGYGGVKVPGAKQVPGADNENKIIPSLLPEDALESEYLGFLQVPDVAGGLVRYLFPWFTNLAPHDVILSEFLRKVLMSVPRKVPAKMVTEFDVSNLNTALAGFIEQQQWEKMMTAFARDDDEEDELGMAQMFGVQKKKKKKRLGREMLEHAIEERLLIEDHEVDKSVTGMSDLEMAQVNGARELARVAREREERHLRSDRKRMTRKWGSTVFASDPSQLAATLARMQEGEHGAGPWSTGRASSGGSKSSSSSGGSWSKSSSRAPVEIAASNGDDTAGGSSSEQSVSRLSSDVVSNPQEAAFEGLHRMEAPATPDRQVLVVGTSPSASSSGCRRHPPFRRRTKSKLSGDTQGPSPEKDIHHHPEAATAHEPVVPPASSPRPERTSREKNVNSDAREASHVPLRELLQEQLLSHDHRDCSKQFFEGQHRTEGSSVHFAEPGGTNPPADDEYSDRGLDDNIDESIHMRMFRERIQALFDSRIASSGYMSLVFNNGVYYGPYEEFEGRGLGSLDELQFMKLSLHPVDGKTLANKDTVLEMVPGPEIGVVPGGGEVGSAGEREESGEGGREMGGEGGATSSTAEPGSFSRGRGVHFEGDHRAPPPRREERTSLENGGDGTAAPVGTDTENSPCATARPEPETAPAPTFTAGPPLLVEGSHSAPVPDKEAKQADTLLTKLAAGGLDHSSEYVRNKAYTGSGMHTSAQLAEDAAGGGKPGEPHERLARYPTYERRSVGSSVSSLFAANIMNTVFSTPLYHTRERDPRLEAMGEKKGVRGAQEDRTDFLRPRDSSLLQLYHSAILSQEHKLAVYNAPPNPDLQKRFQTRMKRLEMENEGRLILRENTDPRRKITAEYLRQQFLLKHHFDQDKARLESFLTGRPGDMLVLAQEKKAYTRTGTQAEVGLDGERRIVKPTPDEEDAAAARTKNDVETNNTEQDDPAKKTALEDQHYDAVYFELFQRYRDLKSRKYAEQYLKKVTGAQEVDPAAAEQAAMAPKDGSADGMALFEAARADYRFSKVMDKLERMNLTLNLKFGGELDDDAILAYANPADTKIGEAEDAQSAERQIKAAADRVREDFRNQENMLDITQDMLGTMKRAFGDPEEGEHQRNLIAQRRLRRGDVPGKKGGSGRDAAPVVVQLSDDPFDGIVGKTPLLSEAKQMAEAHTAIKKLENLLNRYRIATENGARDRVNFEVDVLAGGKAVAKEDVDEGAAARAKKLAERDRQPKIDGKELAGILEGLVKFHTREEAWKERLPVERDPDTESDSAVEVGEGHKVAVVYRNH